MTILENTRSILGVVVLASISACSPDHRAAGETGQVDPGPRRPECIAPSKPGGGFDLTCKLAQKAMMDLDLLTTPMRIT